VKWGAVSAANYYDWRDQNAVFTAVAHFAPWRLNLTGVAEPEQLRGALVSPNFFSALGVAAARGRTFLPDEDVAGKDAVAVVSAGLWNRLFGPAARLAGQSLTLNGGSSTIVGVMPPGFSFPARDIDLWIPLALNAANRQNREGRWLSAMARLKPGVSREQAQQNMNVIAARLERAYPASNAGWGAAVVPLHDWLVGDSRTTLLVLLGAVSFLLLIACSNVANLLLARAAGRSHEMSLRAALGAGRLRIAQQLITESFALSLVGGALGLLLAYWSIGILRSVFPGVIPRVSEVAVDGRVLIFTLLLSAITAALFGVAPAMSASRGNLFEPLKSGGRSPMTGPRAQRSRSVFVVAEIALAMILLVGASLLTRSLLSLMRVDTGFDPRNTLTAQVTLPQSRYRGSAQHVAFFQQVLERIQSLPGVEAAGAVSDLPMRHNEMLFKVSVDGADPRLQAETPRAGVRWVTPGYFRAMRIPLRAGRYFADSDSASAPKVAIVSQSMARRMWPDQDPIGKRVKLDEDASWVTVTGVVSDIRQTDLDAEEAAGLYFPHAQKTQEWLNWMTLVVQTRPELGSLASAIRAQVWAVDKDQPVAEIAPLEQYVAESAAMPRLRTWLLGSFSLVALLLAVVGIYGIVQYSVSRRIHEIGVRVALGATPASVVTLILRSGLKLILTGVVIGLAGAAAATRFLSTLLFNVRPDDAATFLSVALLLTLVALLATYLPARRALRVDPAIALRQE
jgi:putative ABC transport system permease protein